MKRFITHLSIVLLFGAIINVAFAWSFAGWPKNYSEQLTDPDFVLIQHHWGELEVARVLMEDIGWFLSPEEADEVRYAYDPTYSTAFGLAYQNVHILKKIDYYPIIEMFAVRVSSGWPCLALEGVKLSQSQVFAKSKFQTHWLIENPLQIEKRLKSDKHYLPYRPIWPGFAINTLIYATFLWLLTLAPFQLRRHIRRKRCSCLKCGYDLNHADHDICPECGCVCMDCAK